MVGNWKKVIDTKDKVKYRNTKTKKETYGTSYIVKFTPKHKNSGYEAFNLEPYKDYIVWSKARAIKERDFAKNNKKNNITHLFIKETHNSRIVKRKI